MKNHYNFGKGSNMSSSSRSNNTAKYGNNSNNIIKINRDSSGVNHIKHNYVTEINDDNLPQNNRFFNGNLNETTNANNSGDMNMNMNRNMNMNMNMNRNMNRNMYRYMNAHIDENPNLPTGIHNFGNTCYVNSVIQFLFSSNFLIGDFISTEKTLALLSLVQICTFFKDKQCPSSQAIILFKKAVDERFLNFDQQDASEFLSCFLDGIATKMQCTFSAIKCLDNNVNELWIDYANKHKELNSTFCIIFLSIIKCQRGCGHVVFKFDLEYSLILDISKHNALEDCINDYFEPQEIEGYKCDKCHNTGCMKKTFIWKMPDLLIIYLKKYQANVAMNKKSISSTFNITYLDNYLINLSPYLQHVTYIFKSLIQHRGPNLNIGHYTAIGLREIEDNKDKWFIFNDHDVRPIKNEDLNYALSDEAVFMLLYENEKTPTKI